jgi:hypothetical protein
MHTPSQRTNRLVKESVDVEEIFCIYMAQLILPESEMQSPDIWSYRPSRLDEAIRSDLRVKLKAAMASPRETCAYRFIKSEGGPEEGERDALRHVEFAGLVVLVLLGERDAIPVLLKFMRENQDSIRARRIAGGVLFYLTGEDIGNWFLDEETLDLWDKWWERNKSGIGSK